MRLSQNRRKLKLRHRCVFSHIVGCLTLNDKVLRCQIAKNGSQDGIIRGDEEAAQEIIESRPVAGGDCPQGGGRKL